MTTITIDRAVVEQALAALYKAREHVTVHTDGPWQRVENDCHAAITALRAALAEPQPNTLHGWVFKRNADGSIGIFAPPPKPGESQRTSDCVGPGQRDLNELLGKLADHMAAQVQEPMAWMRVIDEAMVTHHLGVADPADDYETAKRKMNNLLCMAQDIGTYFAKQAEPVAWIEHEWSGTGSRKLHFEKRDPTVRDEVVNPVWTPLYTAPPQRKPLTEAEIDEVWNSLIATPDFSRVKIARAIERAHGIKE